MPPHRGHLFACDVAAGLVDRLTVLVCSRDCEPIPGELRHSWMLHSLPPSIDVKHMHRDIPQTPDEHPDFWDIWQQAIVEHHPKPIDRVFGSEAYVFELARVLDAKPVLIDADREIIPVSSSAIRNDPVRHWEYIPGVVRRYYQRRICCLGPESVGKSALCAKLADAFQTRWVPEYGRIYDAHYRQGDGWTAADFVDLARGHKAIREALDQLSGPLLFEDTDILQTIVWAEHLLGRAPDDLLKLLHDHQPPTLYLLLAPTVAWTDDGTRYSGSPGARQWFYERLSALLIEYRYNFETIGGSDWDERSQIAAGFANEIRLQMAQPALI